MAIPQVRGLNGQTGTATVTVPITTALIGDPPVTGDTMLMFVETGNEAATIQGQNGGSWTEVANSPQSTGAAVTGTRITVFTDVYNGTQGNPSLTDSGNHTQAIAIWFSGAATSVDAVHVTGGGTAAGLTTLTTTGITTTVDECLIVVGTADDWDNAGARSANAPTNSSLSNVTEQADGGMTGGNGGGIYIVTGEQSTAGGTGSFVTTGRNASITLEAWLTVAIQPEPAGASEGEATGSIAWSGSVTGTRASAGAATGSIAWAGSVTGTSVHSGSASGDIAWVGSADGEAPVVGPNEGSASGSIAWSGSVTGTNVRSGAATGSIAWAGSVTGTNVHSGSASGAISWAGTVTGAVAHSGEATGAIAWDGLVEGGDVPPPEGSATGSISWEGSATGVRVCSGSTTGTFEWAGAATGESGIVRQHRARWVQGRPVPYVLHQRYRRL